MKKTPTKKVASDVKDMAESKWWLDDEELTQFIIDVLRNNQTEAIRTLATKFGAVDGAGEALSVVTAAVAVTASECARRATIVSNLQQRELELRLLNTLAGTTAKLSRAWDAHRNRHKPEVNVRDVNVAPGGQAVVGVVDLPEGSAAQAAGTQKGKVGRKRLKPEDDASQA
jgi:hypothetical protein